MNDRLEKVIGEMDVELDGRFAFIRTQETNLGKWFFNQNNCQMLFRWLLY